MKGKRDSKVSKHFEKEEEEVDRISQLPDSLIYEIFSFIDMQYAVQTCVLSKRWRNVWRSLPFIRVNFFEYLQEKIALSTDEIENEGYSSFSENLHNKRVGFVSKVFEFRDESDIQMIQLALKVLDDTSIEVLNGWIIQAVNHNIQHLTVQVAYFPNSTNSTYEIPHHLLNCRSLKELTIFFSEATQTEYTDIILPKSMSLSQMKTLRLYGISVSSSELNRLLSSCPLIETVCITKCDIKTNNCRNIIVDSHSLQRLVLKDNRHTYLGPVDDILTYSSNICAPNLKVFWCTGFITEYFSLENLSSVVHAKLNMRFRKEEADETAETYSELPAEEKEVFAKRMVKYLGAVHNVQLLTLSSGFLEVLLQAPGILSRQPPQLCNLKIMKLEMRFTRGCLRSIAYLLKISPIISYLLLESKESNLAEIGDDWDAEFSTCIISRLQFVVIRMVEGCDNEIKFLRFLLKNSMVLGTLILIFQSTGDSLDRGRFTKEITALPRASPGVRIQYLSSEDHTASLLEQRMELLK